MVTAAIKLKDACSLEKNDDKPRQRAKKQRHSFANKGPHSQSYGFLVLVYICQSPTIKKAGHQRTDAFELWLLEKTLENSLDCKEIKPVNPKQNQS